MLSIQACYSQKPLNYNLVLFFSLNLMNTIRPPAKYQTVNILRQLKPNQRTRINSNINLRYSLISLNDLSNPRINAVPIQVSIYL